MRSVLLASLLLVGLAAPAAAAEPAPSSRHLSLNAQPAPDKQPLPRGDAGRLEFSAAPELTVFGASSALALTEADEVAELGVRLAFGVHDLVDVFAGYRYTPDLTRETEDAISLRTQGHAAVAGARARWPIFGELLAAFGQLEVEASVVTLDLSLATAEGSQSAWSAGLTPTVGLESRWAIGDHFRPFTRIGVGYALRLDHDFDAVSFDTDAPSRPVDLGAANLSGLRFSWAFGVRF